MEYGKTITSYLLAHEIKNKKILLMDFSKSAYLNILLGVKKYPNKIIKEKNENKNNFNIQDYIIKINKNINLIYATEIINEKNINNELNKLKEKYDLIIIDINILALAELNQKILKNSDKIIFITETNVLEIKKTQELLKKYVYEWKIYKEKIKIIYNKYNKKSINKKLLNKIFCEFNILGKINYKNNYNLIINKKINLINKKTKKEFKIIIKNIFYKKIKLLKIKKEKFKKINKYINKNEGRKNNGK